MDTQVKQRFHTRKGRNLYKKVQHTLISTATSNSILRTVWTVMGSSLLPTIRRAQTSIPRHILLFLFLCCLCSIANCRKPKVCSVDRCSEVFRAVSDAETNLERCKKLKVHKRCLGRMKKVCRGNLMYHSNVHINRAGMTKNDCANVLKNSTKANEKSKDTCSYEKKGNYKFCGVFGDPHIRTFSDELITCKTNGSWRLVENDYLVVVATNAIVSQYTGATATVKITVIIKEFGECVKMSTYRANVYKPLPATFMDGTSNSENFVVNISQPEPEVVSEINIRHIDTKLVIRKIEGHLTFAITTPEEFVSNLNQRQMCSNGCPTEMQMSHPDVLKKIEMLKPRTEVPMFNEEEAQEYCRKAMLDEVPSCEETDDEHLRSKRDVKEKSKSRSKKEVTPSLTAADAIPISSDELAYSHEDAAFKSWQQLSSSDNKNDDKSKKRRKRKRNRDRKHSRKTNILQDEPARDNRDEKLRKFQEKLQMKIESENAGNKIIVNETNFYFEACVFDLRTTGDITYAKSARAAFSDVTKMHSKGVMAPSASKNVLCALKPRILTTTKPTQTEPTTSSALNVKHSILFAISCSFITTVLLNFNINFIISICFKMHGKNLFKNNNET